MEKTTYNIIEKVIYCLIVTPVLTYILTASYFALMLTFKNILQ